MRQILFSCERVTAENPEVYVYLFILLCCACSAALYVLVESLKDPSRSRYKILLHCVLIVANVVPPELPMILSMGVNSAVLTLMNSSIFCTEPFRIQNAGKVDICCFDKTGTLTEANPKV
jgi:manganese-transporting P-type ATPase